MTDGAILPARVERLQNDEQSVLFFRVKQLLQLGQADLMLLKLQRGFVLRIAVRIVGVAVDQFDPRPA